jgi:Protein of unknown function (DUF5818)
MQMKFSGSALIFLAAVCLLALARAAAGQNTQSSSASQASPAGVQSSASGEKTVTGCVAREGESFVLKTDEGTYEFNTARDLSPYVGKKVRISGHWKATGVTTTAPVKAAASASTEQAPSTKKGGAAKSFVGDLHLHITGEVVGDCEQPK